jgi:predicted membrane protein
MAVLIYQIGIFLAIIISAAFGKKARNVAIILISILTVLQVFTFGLMALQFVTIFVAYYFSSKWFDKKVEAKKVPTKKEVEFQRSKNHKKFDLETESLEERNRMIDEMNRDF